MRRDTAAVWVLLLLTTINFFNYVDRFVVAGMYNTLRAEFGISETAFGLLTTITFGAHAATTIPFGWVADRYDRRKLIAWAVITWSLATVACAVVKQFWLLAFLRAFVGLAEAAYGPAAITILCEVFPPTAKARVVGIYNVGMFFGTTAGLVAGGNLSRFWAFMSVGAPGVPLGLITLALLSITPRATQAASFGGESNRVSLGTVIRQIGRELVSLASTRTLRSLLVGGVLVSFSAGGYITFVQSFVTRYKGFSAREAAATLGAVVLTAGPLGLLIGGTIADRVQRWRPWGRVVTVAIGFLLGTPFGLLVVYVDSTPLFLTSAWFLIFFLVWYNGPISAVIHDCTDPSEAASAQATFNFVIHLIGTAPAGVVIGFAADTLASRHAFTLPTFTALMAVFFFLGAARHVRADMARAKAHAAAGVPPPPPLIHLAH